MMFISAKSFVKRFKGIVSSLKFNVCKHACYSVGFVGERPGFGDHCGGTYNYNTYNYKTFGGNDYGTYNCGTFGGIYSMLMISNSFDRDTDSEIEAQFSAEEKEELQNTTAKPQKQKILRYNMAYKDIYKIVLDMVQNKLDVNAAYHKYKPIHPRLMKRQVTRMFEKWSKRIEELAWIAKKYPHLRRVMSLCLCVFVPQLKQYSYS